MVLDFHTHTIHSDGNLLPIELIRRAIVNGYEAIGVTDHVSVGNVEKVVPALVADCQLAEEHWDIRAIPGVELTHLPPAAIAEVAGLARRLGAALIVVHGETPVEPVPPGTNLAALRCPEVDILAHPGPIDVELGGLAARNGIFLEISARHGHSYANGAVVGAGREAGALFLVNSDTHRPEDILTEDWQRRVALCAGLSEAEAESALQENGRRLLARIEARRAGPRGTMV
ncbi:MAG: histidinol phosphate phosphatase domain-containing protein [Armatimonadota bacterium]